MGQYSELIGSFSRTGNFPLENNYIFESEAALKEFYSLPENNATLHKGLFKIVANSTSDEQSLWWVVRKQTNDELEFKQLITFTDVNDLNSKLKELEEKLNQEIQDRQTADDAIWGDTNHTAIPEGLNSLKKLARAIENLRTELDKLTEKVSTIKEELQAVVGTSVEDIKGYLATLNYSSLTAVSNELHRFLSTKDAANIQINTFPELQDFLTGFTDSDTLKDALAKVVSSIMGDPLPTSNFRTLRGIEDFVRALQSTLENKDINIQSELDQTQIGVGLSGDGAYNPDQSTTYLKEATSVMNALKILDGLINEAINNVNIQAVDTNTVDLTINKTVDKTEISGIVKISTVDGNSVITKNDGIFCKIASTYENGILTIKVNDAIVGQHVIGLSTVVEDAKYDPDQEAIVITFKLLDGTKQVVNIPVGSLIREWVIDNSDPNKVVELTKVEQLGTGPDKLSADVRLFVGENNLLQKKGNALYAGGTSENITHDGKTLATVINELSTDTQTVKTSVEKVASDLATETSRALSAKAKNANDIVTEASRAQVEENRIEGLVTTNKENISQLQTDMKLKAPIDSPVFTGVPQSAMSPDANDSSQRLATTNWVRSVVPSQDTIASLIWANYEE